MNITIILPAVHVTSKRQQRDESPQPTTPFPPISITPSPTPFSEIASASSYNPDDYKDLIEEYNREMAENHLSKSRAEIVARQAAYDDIQITRSAPETAVIGERGRNIGAAYSNTPPALNSSAPCPYCSSSSDSKSEPSLGSLVMERCTETITSVKRGSITGIRPPSRGITETSLSTDRATESPSSVDTVNTVIQSKAYDILGELKEHDVDLERDMGSTLDDSFESIGQEDELYPHQESDHELQRITEESEEILTETTIKTAALSETAKTPTPTQENHFPPDNEVEVDDAKNLEDEDDFLCEPEEEEIQDEEAPVLPKPNDDESQVGKSAPDIVTPPEEKESAEDSSAITTTASENEQQEQQHKEEEAEELLVTPTQPEPEPQPGESNSNSNEKEIHDDIQCQKEDADANEGTMTVEVLTPGEAATQPAESEEARGEEAAAGNEEVTIIVTQDDMPPANVFTSDEEQEIQAESGIEFISDTTESSSSKSDEEHLKRESSTDQSDKGEPETESQHPHPEQPLSHSDSKSDIFEEEEIIKEVHEDSLKNSDSAYFDSHHEFNEESFYNSEKIEDNFTYEEQSDKAFDVDEQSYETSEKSYNYEKDFENESGYEDFDRSFPENSNHSHYDSHHHRHPLNGRNKANEAEKIHRQHTLADIPLLPGKKSFMVKKQKTEDYSSTTTTSTVPLLLKRKVKAYPDPRKPAIYPQRLNKTTLARQALAQEKRRIYLEERIQNFMRNTKSIQTPYGSLDRSFSIDRSNHKILNTTSTSYTKITNDSKKIDKLHHQSTTVSSTTSRPNHESLTQYRKSKIQSPQSLPDISIIDYYMAPSRGLLTSTPDSSLLGKKVKSSRKSNLSSSMSSIRSPTIGIAEVSVVNGSVGGGGGPGSQRRSGGGGGVGGGATPRSGVVIDSIPEETSDFWKAISSEEGYFYTFRVRQTGPVQMVDKGVQTQTGPMNFSKDLHATPSSYPRKRAPPLNNNKNSTVTLPLIDDRDKILREIAETVQLRHDAELRRAELIQRANDMQTLIKEKRDKINRRHEFWHKKYIEESSMTRPLEAACNSLRAELNTVHRRLLAHLEGRDLPLRLRDGPSKKANYKIMAARLQHEIKELQQKAKAAKLRLESEIKLKEQAEREVRELRNDLAHKKVIMSLARSQIASLPAVHSRGYDPLGY